MRVAQILGAVVLLGGLGLGFFGFGAEMFQPKTVTVVLRIENVLPEIASQIKVGDPAYNDIAGAEIGRITKVRSVPQPEIIGDAQGRVHVIEDPLRRRVEVTVEGVGREGGGLVAISSQVVQAGRDTTLISDRYYVQAKVVAVDAR
jgi:hypothetical protein